MGPFKRKQWVNFDLGWICGSAQVLGVAYSHTGFQRQAVAYLLRIDGESQWIDYRRVEARP